MFSATAQHSYHSAINTRLHQPFISLTSQYRRNSTRKYVKPINSVETEKENASSPQSINIEFEKLFKSSARELEVEPLLRELADTEQLGKRGEAWFAAQLALFFCILFPPEPVESLVRFLGVFSAISGVGLVSAGMLSLGNSLSPFPSPRSDEHELITDGAYAYVRHPMYGGLLLLAFGISAATGSDLRFAASFALAYVLDRKAQLEEKALETKYSTYAPMMRDVKRFVPFLY